MNPTILFLFSLLCSFSLEATPVINSFDSLIYVRPNSDLLVQEQINITTDGKSIQHGIYRDFPTRYQTPNRAVNIQFKVLKTEMNGQETPHFENDLSNGVRIYVGDKDRLLAAGTYTFTITYSALGELGYFKDHDELYWNVTGNAWAYPILKAKAIVQLPKGAFETITGYTAYTGVQGSREQNYLAEPLKNEQVLVFQTTKPLEPNQGLTIALGWKKGFVSEISFYQLENNQLLVILAAGSLLIFIYYCCVWLGIRSKKQAQVVIPEYEPPKGYTPAALRYILRMAYDKKVLVSALLNLAVKGFLKIKKDENSKNYSLIKEPDFKGTLAAEEAELGHAFFFGGANIFELKKQTNNIETFFSDRLKNDYESQHFVTNYKHKLIGVGLTFILFAIMALINDQLWPVLCILLFFMATPLILAKVDSSRLKKKILVTLGLIAYFSFLTSFVYGMGSSVFAAKTWLYCLLVLILVGINLIFYRLLSYPTKLGQEINAHTLGFKLFLNATEKDRMNFRNPPNLTPEIFEKYLPYALALGVEQRWAEQFTTILSQTDYQPSWYHDSTAFSSAALASSLAGAFATAVSSSTEAPGSSSGMSDSGSSGGGGGGGGGGGW
ncbi:hypothetical protein BN59_01828 [Legionella massiliensis]|uniref:DUF2207 domain-containing protein n=2 Tax=Legionella massiliensis TaxID=1034943 RepID=A0A078KSY5_9GAMM|nr:hypothetical protein BN59_01828 [Legionella massiliensis]CEE13283.1 hypothetical protein BN1094_01828 [Legionella massiliensis]